MYKYKRLMVALDFTLMDKTLIEYTAELAKLIKPEKIYFVNAQQRMEHANDLIADYPELITPVDERLEDKLRAVVAEHFTGLDQFDTGYQILDGPPMEELLEWTDIKNIDLLIVGRKRELRGSGVMPQRLTRKVMCSVLFVPQGKTFKLDELFLSNDFSENSKMSLELVASLAAKNPDATVYSFHAYQLPTGYYKTGKTEEEFAQIMNDNAVKKYNKQIEKTNLDGIHITPLFVLDKHEEPAVLVNEVAHKKKADLVVIGAKGRTATTALFLGSVAEKLISVDTDIPLLVVKDKEKTFNFFELLKKI